MAPVQLRLSLVSPSTDVGGCEALSESCDACSYCSDECFLSQLPEAAAESIIEQDTCLTSSLCESMSHSALASSSDTTYLDIVSAYSITQLSGILSDPSNGRYGLSWPTDAKSNACRFLTEWSKASRNVNCDKEGVVLVALYYTRSSDQHVCEAKRSNFDQLWSSAIRQPCLIYRKGEQVVVQVLSIQTGTSSVNPIARYQQQSRHSQGNRASSSGEAPPEAAEVDETEATRSTSVDFPLSHGSKHSAKLVCAAVEARSKVARPESTDPETSGRQSRVNAAQYNNPGSQHKRSKPRKQSGSSTSRTPIVSSAVSTSATPGPRHSQPRGIVACAKMCSALATNLNSLNKITTEVVKARLKSERCIDKVSKADPEFKRLHDHLFTAIKGTLHVMFGANFSETKLNRKTIQTVVQRNVGFIL